jgi:hypothetical protein
MDAIGIGPDVNIPADIFQSELAVPRFKIRIRINIGNINGPVACRDF